METKEDAVQEKPGLGPLQFIVIVITLTCGSGPWGLEAGVRDGGPLLTLVAFMVLPFVFCIPQAMMCAEMSSMMPTNHGYIVWVYRAFGSSIGYMSAFNSVAAVMVDQALYPTFIAAYIASASGMGTDWMTEYTIKLSVILCGGLLNVMNVSFLGALAGVIVLLVNIPFALGFFKQIPEINVANQWVLTPPDGQFQYIVWITTVLLEFNGWDTAGCLAGEASFDPSVFFGLSFVAIICDFLICFLPLVGALTIPYAATSWQNGYLVNVYGSAIFGSTKFFFSGVVLLSIFLFFVVELSAQARALQAVAQPYLEVENQQDDELGTYARSLNYERRTIRVGMLPEVLSESWERTNAPAKAVAFQSMITALICAFAPFHLIINLDFVFFSISWIFKFSAFWQLRINEPGATRPFTVPGGKWVAFLCMFSQVCVSLFVLIVSAIETPSVVGGVCLLNAVVFAYKLYSDSVLNKLTDADIEIMNSDDVSLFGAEPKKSETVGLLAGQ